MPFGSSCSYDLPKKCSHYVFEQIKIKYTNTATALFPSILS